MGVLDIILGRDEQGNASKINMALIALLLWRWYQSAGRSGGATSAPSPMPSPSPRDQTTRVPDRAPERIPSPSAGGAGDKDFGPLVDSTRDMPDMRRGGGRRGPMDDMADGGGMGGGGGGLGDILGDILGGGRGMPGGGRGAPRGPGGGGGLGDILGDILGGGRGMQGSRVAGPQGDPFSDLLRGAGAGGLGGLLAGGLGGGVLGDLLKQFDQAGRGEAARSWVSGGDNVPVTPKNIEATFGSDIINQLADQFGLNKSELLNGLSETLPQVVDQLTPDGRLPTEDELARRF